MQLNSLNVSAWQVSFAKQSCLRAARILAPRFGAIASVKNYQDMRYEETKWHDISQCNSQFSTIYYAKDITTKAATI